MQSEPGGEQLAAFARSVGHDFNNLLTAILGSISLAQERLPAKSPASVHLDQAALCVRRATYLARQLLSLSERASAVERNQPVEINELLLGSRQLFETALPAEGVLCYELSADLPPALANPAELESVMLALFLNAGQALPNGRGVVTLRTAECRLSPGASNGPQSGKAAGSPTEELEFAVQPPPGRYVTVEVADDGIGIPQGVRLRVFEPLFTTVPGRRGLGLYYAARALSGMGGAIAVGTGPHERGTRAVVYLPAAEDEHRRPSASSEETTHERAKGRKPSSPPRKTG